MRQRKQVEKAARPGKGKGTGGVGSDDTDSGEDNYAKKVKAGQVFINNYGAGGGIELPFGGTGKSGHGREKGFEALYGFSQLKTIANFHG